MESESVKASVWGRIRPKLTKKLVLILCAILLAAAALIWYLLGGNVARRLTVEAGTASVDANSFLHLPLGSAVFVSDLSIVDLNKPGDYPVQLQVGNRVFDRVLRVQDTVSPTATATPLTAVSVAMPEPEAFLTDVQDISSVTASYADLPDMSKEGDQQVELILTDACGNTTSLETTLTVVVDRQKPTIEGLAPLRVYMDHTPDYLSHLSVADDWDPNPALTVDDSKVDLSQAGSYEISYRATDASGNEAVVPGTITVIFDNTAPAIYGVHNISLYAGSTISYRSGIKVEDDTDAAPTLAIDSGNVNLSEPGTYKVTYTATDAAGNVKSVTATVTVAKKSSSYVAEDVIYAAVDEILAEIITEDMTGEEKLKAVYDYIVSHHRYSSYVNKTDVVQVAYKFMTSKKGNCYSYYALSKVMLDRLGFPNMMAQRTPNKHRPFNHYWNIVSIDGGETWYHFDSTPRSPSMKGMHMMTDADLDWFDANRIRGYYTRDLSLYPATPKE